MLLEHLLIVHGDFEYHHHHYYYLWLKQNQCVKYEHFETNCRYHFYLQKYHSLVLDQLLPIQSDGYELSVAHYLGLHCV